MHDWASRHCGAIAIDPEDNIPVEHEIVSLNSLLKTLMNLLVDPWLPVIRLSGKRDLVAPSGILGADPAMALDLPRADFAGAMTEFLIGLLTTAYAPTTDVEWAKLLFGPPAPETLDRAFAPFVSAFAIDGEGARFMQDFDPLDAEPKPIASLLMDQPGEQGRERNTDVFVRGGTVRTMSRAAAAMALYTLQTYAPSGGKGYRVSLRGGGPLTTLVDLTDLDVTKLPPTLWTLVWANVLTRPTGDPLDPKEIFPWLSPSRTSKEGIGVPPDPAVGDVAAFWGMPRRVRLAFEAAEGRSCDVLGVQDAVLSAALTTVAYGPKYEAWVHPLSPYYKSKPGEPLLLSYHAQPGGIRYRQWPTFTCFREDDTSKPAMVVSAIQSTLRRNALRRGLGDSVRRIALRAFGFDMDNMKARCWYEGRMPVELVEPEHRRAFEIAEFDAVKFADTAARAVVWEIKCARVDRPKELRGDFGDYEDAFWRTTEDAFKDFLGAAHARLAAGESDLQPALAVWQSALRAAALDLFDRATPKPHEIDSMKRVVLARARLTTTLRFDPDAGKMRRPRAKGES
jgi:CRISPR system Cascade subunit CasA